MPYNRPTLTELREQAISDIESSQQSLGSLLRFSNMRILGHVNAGMAHLHFGYLDYIAKQATPYTATGEYLASWAALKNIYRKPASSAICQQVKFTGIAGRTLDAGTILLRSDGYQYTLDNEITIGLDGSAIGLITAILKDASEDITCGGQDGNADSGTLLTLDVSKDGIDSEVTAIDAITGGADIENEDSFRTRMLKAYQNPPQGGSISDYEQWALSVAGVTRVWVIPRAMGAGSVGIYVMFDNNDNDGFPVGTDGLSENEPWGSTKATGDQLAVANYIYEVQPVTALVWLCSPLRKIINFTMSGLTDITQSIKKEIEEAIKLVFINDDVIPGGTVNLSSIITAISAINGTDGFIITSITTNISLGTGELPVLGEITYV